MEKLIERGLFASRWLLAPMYIGLVGALFLLLVASYNEMSYYVLKFPAITTEDAILGTLTLIDLTLAGNLVLIVILSGYENFVSKMDLKDHVDRPEWQGHVDFTGLKLKLVASIVAISGIHLLKVFMDIGKYTDMQIMWAVIIHLVFVISGVLLALMDRITVASRSAKDD